MAVKKALSIVSLVILSLCAVHVSNGLADFPERHITLINPMSPGGSRDVMARAFASIAEKVLGQPLVVVNKPGASGMIGMLAGAQANPDGYTLTVTSSGDTCALEWEIANGRKSLYTLQDFVPIGSVMLTPSLVVCPYNSQWKSLTDMVKDCKAKPSHYAYASGGMYGIVHISTEILMKAAGIKARNVPYQGGGPALNAVVGGHVDFSLQYPATSIPLARGNKLKVLGAMGDKRVGSLPDVLTAKEQGVDGVSYQMVGFLVPKKTPMPVVEKLRTTLAKVVKEKAFIDVVTGLGEEVHYMDGDELRRYLDRETEMISKVMRDLAKEAPQK